MVPDRQQLSGNVPFNLMKSEKLVWVMDDVDYIETVVRRERRGSSQGLSIRIARGVYYRPSAFRSRAIEWEETVHQDTGLLGFTTKHIYFSGPKKKFRVRYDRIVDLEPYDGGFGIMKDNQTPSRRRSGPETGGSHTTWPSTSPRCRASKKPAALVETPTPQIPRKGP